MIDLSISKFYLKLIVMLSLIAFIKMPIINQSHCKNFESNYQYLFTISFIRIVSQFD